MSPLGGMPTRIDGSFSMSSALAAADISRRARAATSASPGWRGATRATRSSLPVCASSRCRTSSARERAGAVGAQQTAQLHDVNRSFAIVTARTPDHSLYMGPHSETSSWSA